MSAYCLNRDAPLKEKSPAFCGRFEGLSLTASVLYGFMLGISGEYVILTYSSAFQHAPFCELNRDSWGFLAFPLQYCPDIGECGRFLERIKMDQKTDIKGFQMTING